MDLREDLPFRTEYSKSGRAGCKTCKTNIPKDVIRMAVMVQSPFFDGKSPNWHHFDCFFKKYRPKGVEEIAHFANLKYEDQKRIESAIEKVGSGEQSTTASNASDGKKKSRKKKATEDSVAVDTNGTDINEFKVEYAKTNRSKCRLCENTIKKDTIRISRLDRDSEDARRFGPLDRWFHVECFVSARVNLKFFTTADKLPFFSGLEEEDKKLLKKKLPQIEKPADCETNCESPAKKPKLSSGDDKKLKKQSDLLFKYQEFLKSMKKQDLIELMEYNKIEVPEGMPSKFERTADAMTFGVPNKCPECKKGQLVFRITGYICTGNVDQWTKCSYQTTDQPKRKPFKVPKEMVEEYDFLADYKFKERDRIYNLVLKHAMENIKPSTSSATDLLPKKEETNGKVISKLSGYNFASIGKTKTLKSTLKQRFTKLGAKLIDQIDRTVLCIISTKAEFDKQKDKIIAAKELSIPIVTEEALVAFEDNAEPVQAISLNRVDDFEVDIEKRYTNLNVKEKMKSAFKSGVKSGSFEKSGKQKMILKDGNVVDPDCEVAEVTHIYKDGKDIYSVVLSKVDVSKNKNSFYKLQLLEHDTKKGKYFVYRSWGRVGTTIGGNTLEKFSKVSDALDFFEDNYKEKTGNDWNKRHKFKKNPDLYYPVDIDYGGDQTEQFVKLEVGNNSKLSKEIQDFICNIFDVQKMKEQMLEFELDLEKMPLGKLSKKQLLNACSVLKELSQLIDVKPPNMNKLKTATNKFFTLVPHNFGTDKPPLIDNEEMIKTKMEMLDTLLDIEMAYDMISTNGEKVIEEDPIDHHYKKLNTKLEVLTKDLEEYTIIEKYLKNTHGSTHHFNLEIIDIMKVERNGEIDKYAKWKHIENRMLLWHGSRVTNFAGILSQGLRIAPPEAPVTGYMFGKGIYFADMVTKSAGYCHSQANKNIGYLLLSEVAIGEPWELKDAKDVKKLPKGKHSVKGIGETEPDPNEIHVLPDGLKVPLGKGVKAKDKTSLLYNEYIVYDVNQVNIKYLLKCKFNSNMF
ncbi:poly [ADP-ribose] polymerase 1-like [Oppia nitens]|uniref:poly [ADP-ribose] polymerase 1-like n=1 Tax=Oppia nitens TaxID=1686743 RepID=UPI0023DBDA1B|nr:poly [ADP-ribose] polymerase 1-like [Oppia nitens]